MVDYIVNLQINYTYTTFKVLDNIYYEYLSDTMFSTNFTFL